LIGQFFLIFTRNVQPLAVCVTPGPRVPRQVNPPFGCATQFLQAVGRRYRPPSFTDR
jgi:hypothetical protein